MPQDSPSLRPTRGSHDDLLLNASTDELPHLHPSPPYRPFPSSSNLHLEHYPPSPPYDATFMTDTQHPVPIPITDKRKDDANTPTKPKAVHYPDNVKPALPYPYTRQDSDFMSSRTPSIAATDDDDDSDYDWSGEDDLVDQEAKFEQQHMGVKTAPQGCGFRRIITLLFSTLIGSVFLAGVLITPALLIHFYWYEPHPTEFRRYVKDNVQCWLFWAAANLVISWGLAMLIDLVPVVTRLFIAAAWGHVSEYVKTRIELYNSVKDTAKPAFYAASSWASWIIIFAKIYDLYDDDDVTKSQAPYTRRVAQVVQFFFFLALIWCAQRMLSHFIAFSFHSTAYKDRIEYLQEALEVIEKLRDYRPKFTHHAQRSGARTPFGFGYSTTPMTDKEHFKFVSGALQNATPRRPNTRFGPTDEGDDGDVDEGDKTLVGSSKKGKARLSWFGTGGNRGKHSRQATADEQGKKAGSIDEEIEMLPRSRPMTPSQLNPHRYPPSSRNSPNHSVDNHTPNSGDGDATLMQAAKLLKNAVLHDARNISGKFEEGVTNISWNVGSSHEAKHLARSIYMRFKDRGRNYLLPSDFYPAFATHEVAEKAFGVFDKDDNGDISRAEIKTTLLKVYKERRFLSRSLRDVSEALKTLNRILLFFAAVILFFISLSVFGVNVGDSLTSVYSIGIAASFIFKNAASSAFDAIMFLFVTHPYDTGDRCFIDAENLVVKKVGLFATVFTRSDGTETYYFNSQLFSKFITNVRRSGNTFENLSMQIAWKTPLEKLDQLEKCLNVWLSTEENRWFVPSTNITLQHIVYQRYLELTIGIGHNSNWQDWGLRNSRKTAFHAAVQYYCHQLGIIGYEAPLPIVYANPATNLYDPSPPATPDPYPATDAHMTDEQGIVNRAAKEVKPNLGFLPPLSTRASHLTRARKSKSRNAVLKSMATES
ncbi:Mechanosensitive ion channel-domain-containing protein [Cyathus striatus]|nr:Mechanosensitive ion channel-domain-containing protein [Cyathus striatus]